MLNKLLTRCLKIKKLALTSWSQCTTEHGAVVGWTLPFPTSWRGPVCEQRLLPGKTLLRKTSRWDRAQGLYQFSFFALARWATE